MTKDFIAANDNAPLDTLLKLREVMQITKLGSSTIYRRMASSTFPRPLELGPGTVRWRASELRAWMDALPVTQGRAAA